MNKYIGGAFTHNRIVHNLAERATNTSPCHQVLSPPSNHTNTQRERERQTDTANLRAQQEKPRAEPSAPRVRFAKEVSIIPTPARKRVRFDSRVVVFGARRRSSIIRLGEKVSIVRQGRVRFSMKTRVIEIDRMAAPTSEKVSEILELSE